jgi:hypothetical protein
MEIVAVSRFLKGPSKEGFCLFHFKGFYKGVKIHSLYLKTDEKLILGEDYILHIEVDKIEDNYLYGFIKRYRAINKILIG